MSAPPEEPTFPKTLAAAPKQVLIGSIGVLTSSLWLLLCWRNGKPASWLGELAYYSALIGALIGAPTLSLLAGLDLVRRMRTRITLVVFGCAVISGLQVGMFLWFRVRDAFSP